MRGESTLHAAWQGQHDNDFQGRWSARLIDQLHITHSSFVTNEHNRNRLETTVGQITHDNIIRVMLKSKIYWKEVAIYIKEILHRKKTP